MFTDNRSGACSNHLARSQQNGRQTRSVKISEKGAKKAHSKNTCITLKV